MDKKILSFLFRLMLVFFMVIFIVGFFSEVLKPVMLPNVNVAAIGNSGIKRRVKQTGRIEPLRSEVLRCLETIEILDVAAEKGAAVSVGDPLVRVRIRAGSGTEPVRGLERAFDSLQDQSKRLLLQVNHADDEAWAAWTEYRQKESEILVMESLYEMGMISEREWGEWNKQLRELNQLWEQSAAMSGNEQRWKEEERKIVVERLERVLFELEELRAQCSVEIAEDGWIHSRIDGIVMEAPAIDCLITSMEPIMKIAEVTDHTSVKLVTEISSSDYEWVGDNLLVYIRTPKGLLKTYTENIYQTDHQTVVFESLFNKAYDDEIRLGQTYNTMIERQQRFLSTITIPKALISAPGGFYNRGTGRVKIIRQESGILGDEFFIDEVPIRMIVVGDERVITLPIGGLLVLNGDNLEPGTKVFINQ